jgi:predicted HAD superfamily Cof-like phosphohydrolase
MSHDFFKEIKKFNDLYKLENNSVPTLLPVQRITQFYDILKEEMEEGVEIASKYSKMQDNKGLTVQQESEILTELADWLGDIIVYCASEGQRWGIPIPKVLEVIMSSNFSKLDADGQPIYDHRGKVMKGPNYWRPEEKIMSLIQKSRAKEVDHEL